MASQRFELVALLNGRLVAFGPPADVFTEEHITAAFGGQALFLEGMVVIDQCCPGHVGNGVDHRHSHAPRERAMRGAEMEGRGRDAAFAR